MRLTTVTIPAGLDEGLAVAFPGASSGQGGGETRSGPEPIALLSFACAGDMKYGDARCASNRERFLGWAGMEISRLRGLELSHSRRVVLASEAEDHAALALAVGGADGMILAAGDDCASVTVADCMPIWILDRRSGAFGILHSGWRGTGILRTAVEALVAEYGARPTDIAVILGPAIGPCCYEVPEGRAAAFAAEFGEGAVERRGSSSRLDLRSANLSMAEGLGVGDLLSIEACSSCDGRLGSYRRQGGASFTRMLAVCGRSPRPPNLAPRSPGIPPAGILP